MAALLFVKQFAMPLQIPSPTITDDLSWLDGGGDMGALIRSMDWSATPLGPLAQWPQSLRTSVSLCLSSTFPILVAWGPEHIQIYNDAYRPICGAKHPSSMGEPFKVCWATALPVVGDAFDSASRGHGAYIHDQQMILDRYGYLEEAFMTFSFSPIRDESGGVGGIFHPITESTGTVIGARRTQGLRELSASVAAARSIAEIGQQMAAQSAAMALDLPFVLFYQIDAAGADGVRLLASAGLDAHSGLAGVHWPFAEAARLRAPQQVDGIARWFAGAPCGPFDDAPDAALVLPVALPGRVDLFGFVVAGASARRLLDTDYLSFYERLRAVVETAVGNVLAWEQEQQRATALEKIDQAKTAFFSNVSHEFRTPLTLILGPLDDALADAKDALAPGQRTRLELTRRNALRLLKLVNSLLDFSRIEAGRVQASYVPVDLARLTGELASVFESAMEKGGLAYSVAVRDPGEPVFVDRDMWEKIVFNLLSNAFKFTLNGGVTLQLGRHGNGVRLSVIDTGAGIPAAELGRVFERFHRIEGAPGRTYEGTGIGLALIQELVQLHGGQIAVTSTLGQGSRFDVDVPFGSAHLPQDRVGQADAAPFSDEQRMGAAFVEEALRWLPDAEPAAPMFPMVPLAGRATILVADDNNDMRAYVQSLLAPYYSVRACADGEAALALALAEPPDLLLSDVMMPKLDGFGLLAQVRASAALQHVPVILLSARAGEEARIEGLQAGADDYLAKPFAAAELLARVQHQVALAANRQRERAQRELSAQREAYFRALTDAAPVMLWRTDETGACTYLSERWYDYTGRTPEQDLGAGWLDNIHPDDLPGVRASLHAAMAARSALSIDYRLRRRDGAWRWVIDAGRPHTDEAGRPDGFVGTVIDIHERTVLQESFERLARELLEKNRLQSEFLITLAHELRNPLAPIRTGLELMRLRPAAANTGTIHAMMQRQVNHMAHLVDDLLDVTRLTEGKVTLQKGPVLLAGVVNDALEMSMPLVTAGAHQLTVALLDAPLTLDADRHRIAQVLSNLVNNAAKYTPKGGRIAVRAQLENRHRDGAAQGGVAIEVADNGIGIAPDVLATVFDLYTQARDGAAMAQGGLGVGLHLVQRLVQLHGGEVDARSAGAGQGSAFTVWLPLGVGGDALLADPAPEHDTPPAAHRLDVLVVDDNVDAAIMLGELLDASGHRVVLAHDGAAALAAAAKDLPHVVFLDIGLPDISGLDVALALRRIDGMAGATLVALTGWGAEADRARTLAAGFDSHLTKPAQFDSVHQLLVGVAARTQRLLPEAT
jgi:PAS domain S-box-containing protein